MTNTEVSTKIVGPFDQSSPSKQLYKAGPSEFVYITLRLTSAGPCAIGTKTNLLPIGGSNGQLLPINQERRILLTPGTILWATSIGAQRIDFTVEPIPYVQNILFAVERLTAGVFQALAAWMGKKPLAGVSVTPKCGG